MNDPPDHYLGRNIPYSFVDVFAITGWAAVATDHENSLTPWLFSATRSGTQSPLYPDVIRLSICADCGVQSGRRFRAWEIGLACPAAESEFSVIVCSLPPV